MHWLLALKDLYDQVNPLGHTQAATDVFWWIMNSPYNFFGAVFADSQGHAPAWAIYIDNIVDMLPIEKVDH